jgi:hypothetical protein
VQGGFSTLPLAAEVRNEQDGPRFGPVISEPLIGAKAVCTTMDSKVTALERAFQLAG